MLREQGSTSMLLGGLILAGGGSVRMGADKSVLLWNGRTATARCRDLARAAGCQTTVVVGAGGDVADDHPGAGPVGGLIAGVRALREQGCHRALVLAVDAPTLRLDDLWPLLESAPPGAYFEGLPLPMVVDLSAVPSDAVAGWPMFRFVLRAGLVQLAGSAAARARIRGANTPSERQALMDELRAHEGAQESSAG